MTPAQSIIIIINNNASAIRRRTRKRDLLFPTPHCTNCMTICSRATLSTRRGWHTCTANKSMTNRRRFHSNGIYLLLLPMVVVGDNPLMLWLICMSRRWLTILYLADWRQMKGKQQRNANSVSVRIRKFHGRLFCAPKAKLSWNVRHWNCILITHNAAV